MAKKKVKPSLWKLSLAIGILLGAAVKIFDYYKVRYIRCGVFSPPEACTGLSQYLKELPVWIILGILATFIVIYGGKYLVIHGYHLTKDAKMPKAEKHKTIKDTKKQSKEKEKPEEKKEEPKKKIKI